VLPKITSATDDSSKTEPARTERLVAAVIAKTPLGDPPLSFHLDSHALPCRDAAPDREHHGVPIRHRALPTVMAFVTPAAGRRVLGDATTTALRAEADSLVPKDAASWNEPTGHDPDRWLVDSRITLVNRSHSSTSIGCAATRAGTWTAIGR
jgi:hypothetical protein